MLARDDSRYLAFIWIPRTKIDTDTGEQSHALEKGQILITLFKPLNHHPLNSNLLLEFSLARATTFYFCLAHCEMDFLSFATKSHN